MAGRNLSGIERQLVLDYIRDGNAPLTLSLANAHLPANSLPSSTLFHVAARDEQVKAMAQGVILLQDSENKAAFFAGKTVTVNFYFNRLALFFETRAQPVPGGLVLALPDFICKVEDKMENQKNAFSVVVYYESSSRKASGKSRKTDISCDFDEAYPLFFESDYMELVNKCLSQKIKKEREAIAGRIHSPKLVYFDRKRMLFLSDRGEMPFVPDCEYACLVSFPLEGPVRERKVYLSFVIEDLYESFDRSRLCACARISSIQEEDSRFISDKVKTNTK